MRSLLQWKDSFLSKEHKYQKRSRNRLFLGRQTAHNSSILGLFSTISYHFLSYAGPFTTERFLSFWGTRYQKRSCNGLFLGHQTAHISSIFAHFGAISSNFSLFPVVQLAISTSKHNKYSEIIYLIQRRQKYAHYAVWKSHGDFQKGCHRCSHWNSVPNECRKANLFRATGCGDDIVL